MTTTGCSAQATEPFALRVIGPSMEPEFHDGNIIIVDPGHPLINGVYAVIEKHDSSGTEVIFGQYLERGRQRWLRYLNPAFDDIELPAEISVKGVVVQRNGRRRKEIKHYDYNVME
jgi:SOS-response transcriptional repressor LexA